MHFGQRLLQAVDHGDGVLVLGLLHREQQRPLAVEERQALNFLRAVDHARELPNPHGRAVLARNDNPAKIFRPFEPGFYLDDPLLLARPYRTQRQFLVLAAHRSHHLVGRDAKGL